MNHLISQIPKSTFWQTWLLLTLLGSIISTLSQTEDTIHFFSLAVGWPSSVACLPFFFIKDMNSIHINILSDVKMTYSTLTELPL